MLKINQAPELVYVLSSQVGEVGGAAKATRLLCEALAKMKNRVRLFVTLPPDEVTAQRLARQNIEIVTPRFNKGWRHNLPQKQIAFQLFQWLRREKPSRVLSVSLSVEARYLLQLPRTSPVFLWETTEALPHVKFVDNAIHHHLSKAAGLLAPSEIVTRNIRSTYKYDGPIKRLPFWCDAPSHVLAPTNTRSGHFLYVGRMDKDKGFEFLFPAFARLKEQHPGARLTVRGGGEVDAIRHMAQGVAGIDVGGYVDGDEYERLLASCDGLVLPSLHEGYPLSLLEACARGKPIIATRVGSIPEVFENQACALLVPPGDTTALSNALLKIALEDSETYRERCCDATRVFEKISSPQAIEDFLRRALEP